MLTRKVRIDARAIPHSHPVLTLHTRHIGDTPHLLATFVHEQLHWLEAEPWLARFRAAMRDFQTLYPELPNKGVARDVESTYRHLLVCDLELQALTTLIGEENARQALDGFTHYTWIYDQVLSNPKIREVALSHGFDVRNGVPRG